MSRPPLPRIVWRELWTPAPAAAARFLDQLFGWRRDPTRAIFAIDGRPVAGLHVLAEDSGEPSRWLVHIAVESLGAACARVEQAQGRVIRRMRIDSLGGEAAVVVDRIGAELVLVECASPLEEDGDDDVEPLHFWWSELACPEPGEAVAFYRDVLGWSSLDAPLGDLDLRFFLDGERRLASAVQDPWLAGGGAAWLSYVLVTDLEATCQRAEQSGGRVERAPVVVPEMGSFASVVDPSGARLALWQHQNATASGPAIRS